MEILSLITTFGLMFVGLWFNFYQFKARFEYKKEGNKLYCTAEWPCNWNIALKRKVTKRILNVEKSFFDLMRNSNTVILYQNLKIIYIHLKTTVVKMMSKISNT